MSYLVSIIWLFLLAVKWFCWWKYSKNQYPLGTALKDREDQSILIGMRYRKFPTVSLVISDPLLDQASDFGGFRGWVSWSNFWVSWFLQNQRFEPQKILRIFLIFWQRMEEGWQILGEIYILHEITSILYIANTGTSRTIQQILEFCVFQWSVFSAWKLSLSMILNILLIFGDLSLDDSYKISSYEKSVYYLKTSLDYL